MNNQSVSQLSVFDKLLEKLVYIRVYTFWLNMIFYKSINLASERIILHVNDMTMTSRFLLILIYLLQVRSMSS